MKPAWVQRVTRDAVFVPPPEPMSSNIIVSDERLGTFVRQSPEATADRLSKVFNDGVVIYVLRNPIELFYSAYRQGLVNFIDLQRQEIEQTGRASLPASADEFFDGEWTRYRKFGVGFFSMIHLRRIRRGFERFFGFETVEFDLLKQSSSAFVAAFTRACGNELKLELAHTNRAEREVVEDALAALPADVPELLRTRCREQYEFSRLNSSREDFLRSWNYNAGLEEFAAAFKF